MKTHHIIPSAVVIVFGVIAVSAFIGGNPNKVTAIGEDKLAASEGDQAKNSDGAFSPFVDEGGKISLPTDYKKEWSHLGSWAVARTKGESIDEMHLVYTQPETIAAYNKTGEFPDGAVLVKEVRETKADRLTTGHSSWSQDMKIWFVMIKDRKGRFADNDHWGDGWGWALFEAKDPTKNVSAGYDTSCLACHSPVEDRDWVYTYGYPDLKGPKK